MNSAAPTEILERLSAWRLPLFLMLAIMLGGTSQAVNAPKLFIYGLSAVLIAWVFVTAKLRDIMRRSGGYFCLSLVLIIFAVISTLPLPAEIWSTLPGRALIADGFAETANLPALPLAMSPGHVLGSVCLILPVLAAYALTVHVAQRSEIIRAVWCVGLVAMGSFILGGLQSLTAREALYFYAKTSVGLPVGVFSNPNHQVTLFGIGFCLIAGLTMRNLSKRRGGRDKPVSLVGAGLILTALTLGLITNGSIAGHVILPILALCFLGIFFINRSQSRIGLLITTAFIGFIAVNSFITDNLFETVLSALNKDGSTSRSVLFSTTGDAIAASFPAGTGLGSFRDVYRSFETFDMVNKLVANHAHNDYLEWVLETGVVGVILLLGFAGLVLWDGVRIATSTRGKAVLGKAAFVALMVIALHSTVDYPVRTIAIATLAGFCVGLLRRAVVVQKDALR